MRTRSIQTYASLACALTFGISSMLAACSDDVVGGVGPTDAGGPLDGTLPGADGATRRDDGATPQHDAGTTADGSPDRDSGPPSASCAPDITSGGTAKNIVFFLGDGMGIPVLTAARIYAVGEEGSLTIDTLPETGFVRTYSRSHMVTDSAPSMSAYMTGVKMDNDVIAMTPDTVADTSKCVGTSKFNPDAGVSSNGMPAATILELAKKMGKSVGVVTTTRVTHATPAAAYAHICHRDLEDDIAAQAVPRWRGVQRRTRRRTRRPARRRQGAVRHCQAVRPA